MPYNYILLFLFTICEGYIFSFLCSIVYDSNGCIKHLYIIGFVVIMVITFTLATVVGLTIYTVISKDFKLKRAILYMVCIDLFIFGIMTGIYYDNVRNMIFSFICAIILGLYLVGDFWLIVSGEVCIFWNI